MNPFFRSSGTSFVKNKGYTHEQEVQVVIYDTYCASQAILNTEEFHNLLSLGLKDPEKRRGVNVPIDVAVLIHEIVVSPAFPRWAIKSLQKAVVQHSSRHHR